MTMAPTNEDDARFPGSGPSAADHAGFPSSVGPRMRSERPFGITQMSAAAHAERSSTARLWLSDTP